MSELNFKNKMERLEVIVKQLEDNQIDLENAITLFEEGLKLVKQCNTTLNEFDNKIQTLIQQFEENENE